MTPDGNAWIDSNLPGGGIIPSYGNLDLILVGFYRTRSFCRELQKKRKNCVAIQLYSFNDGAPLNRLGGWGDTGGSG